MVEFERINYSELNAKQKENYNFQKVSSVLADYGYNCLRLTDDWQGADFIACHKDGEKYLKVQLKARLTIDKKYLDKGVFVAFRDAEFIYIYPHDLFTEKALEIKKTSATIGESSSWELNGRYSWPSPPKWAMSFLKNYRLPNK